MNIVRITELQTYKDICQILEEAKVKLVLTKPWSAKRKVKAIDFIDKVKSSD